MASFLDKLLRRWRSEIAAKHIQNNSIVYDVGCGKDAFFLKSISERICLGIGLDEEIGNFQNAKIELRKIRIAKELPFPNESCDIITMLAVLEHLSDVQAIFRESLRVLKKGGKLILTTPTPLAKSLLEVLAFKLRLIDKEEIKDHKNYFWPKDVKKMLKQIGFEEKNIKTGYFEFFLNSLIIAKK